MRCALSTECCAALRLDGMNAHPACCPAGPPPSQEQVQAPKSTLPCRQACRACGQGQAGSNSASRLICRPAYLPSSLHDRPPARVHKPVSIPVNSRLSDNDLIVQADPGQQAPACCPQLIPMTACAMAAQLSPAISLRAWHRQHGLRKAASWDRWDQMFRQA